MSSSPILSLAPLFSDMAAQELDALATLLQRRRFKKGEVIFRQGDPGLTLYIIESGEIKLTLTSAEGKEVILALVGPGGFFGELAVLDGEPRSADAVARVPSWLLSLHREPFLDFLKTHPNTAVSLIAALSRRLRRTTEQVQDAAFLDVSGRLARALLQLSQAKERVGPDGVLHSPRLTQGEIADLAGTTRETVNKWLGFFERHGLIRRDKGRVQVLKPDELRKRIY